VNSSVAAGRLLRGGFVLLLLGTIATAAEPDPQISSRLIAPTLRLARQFLLAGNLDAAHKQVESLVEANPADARALGLLGDVLFRQSKFGDAERAYRLSVQTDPHYARGHWGLGRMAMLWSDPVSARDHFAFAFQLDAQDPDIVLSHSDFVAEPAARITLLRTYLSLADGTQDRIRIEDAAARLEIAQHLGQRGVAELTSPYRPYRLKLAGYFPNGGAQSGLLVEVSINGKPMRFLLDSGADGIFVSGERAQRAGLERIASARVGGVGSVHDGSAFVALAHQVSMGDLQLKDCLVKVTEPGSVPDADGVIGVNVFANFIVRIDPPARTLDLVPFADRGDAGSAASGAIRAYRVGHLLLVDALMNGQSDGLFLLDTGASFSSTPGWGLGETAGSAEIEVRGMRGQVNGALRAPPIRLTIGGKQLIDEKPVRLDLREVSRAEGVEISGIAGYPLLSKSVLVINYRDGLVQFDQAGR
jgi:hypothetical protein